MRFSLLSLGWVVFYFAIALWALQNPNGAIAGITTLLWQLSMAIALILAFHFRSTPLFSFVVFSVLAVYGAGFQIHKLTIPVMVALQVKTGAVEYELVQEMLLCHLSFLLGILGAVVGQVVVLLFPQNVKSATLAPYSEKKGALNSAESPSAKDT